MSKIERRNITVELRADDESRMVEGHAALFETPSDRMPYKEIIKRGAFDGVIAKSDVFALLNHNDSRGILGRCTNGKGSLKLEIDERGLKYSFEAPNTALGNELLEYLRRGEVTESSFAFTVEEDEVHRDKDDNITRTIVKFEELYDVSPVYRAAYSSTNVYARSVEEMEKELAEIEEREEEEKEVIPESYYKKMENKFK